MGYGYYGRRKPAPVVPGEWCPARRTSKAFDPKVTETGRTLTQRTGTRICPRCGVTATMTQALDGWAGAPLNAWYYEPHRVPKPDDSGSER